MRKWKTKEMNVGLVESRLNEAGTHSTHLWLCQTRPFCFAPSTANFVYVLLVEEEVVAAILIDLVCDIWGIG